MSPLSPVDLTLLEDDDVEILLEISGSRTSSVHDLERYNLRAPEDEGGIQPELRSNAAPRVPVRNPPLLLPYCLVDEWEHNGMKIRPNDTVELSDNAGFLLIRGIVLNAATGAVIVRGNRIQRTKDLDGMLGKKLNECVLVYDVDLDDPRSPEKQAVTEVTIHTIVGVREVRFTDREFPRWRMIPNSYNATDIPHLYKNGGLTVRWVMITYYKSAIHRSSGKEKAFETTLRRILPEEASENFKVVERPICRKTNEYTFIDGFCGAGGAARGAQQAGAKIVCGFDFCEFASQAWEGNFPESISFCLSADKFIQAWKEISKGNRVDILHLSPPCQFFSPMHTIPGVNDEMNTASLFAIEEIVKATSSRFVTLEETLGLANTEKHQLYFNALINMFTSLNFSVRWSVVPLITWGLPQNRKRLIVIASAPGEILPRMPKPTHSEDGSIGLKRYTVVNQAIGHLQASPRNDQDFRLYSPDERNAPYDGDKPLKWTIICSRSYPAPCGMRPLTIRELAALQGFPSNHIFTGSMEAKRRQIGNAFPPVAARVLFKSIIEELKSVDRVDGNAPILIED